MGRNYAYCEIDPHGEFVLCCEDRIEPYQFPMTKKD